MHLKEGEIITLDNNKNYIVFKIGNCNSVRYVLLMTEEKPLSMIVGKEIIEGENVSIKTIDNEEELRYAIDFMYNTALNEAQNEGSN